MKEFKKFVIEHCNEDFINGFLWGEATIIILLIYGYYSK